LDIISRYVTRDFLVTLLLTLAVFTFVMCVGAIIKAIDLFAKGLSGWLIIQAFIRNIPFILSFSIPISTLTSSLLVFSRLSMDGEITAMRACGLSLWQIVAPVILVAVLLSMFCIYLNCWAAPDAHLARRKMLRSVDIGDPINLLEEGRFVRDFPGVMVYVGKKGKHEVEGIVVYELDDKGVKRSVRAKTGTVGIDTNKKQIVVDLYDVRIDQPDRDNPTDLSLSRHVTARHYPIRLDSDEIRKGKLKKKVADMRVNEIISKVRHLSEELQDMKAEDIMKERIALLVEANQRLALSLSCFAFTLLGIPLGMKSRRKESSIGVLISLFLVFVYYLFIIIADALVARPELRPDMIIWIPVVGMEIIGFLLLRRHQRSV
jgi:lipopolysaccharide export system permease protein